MTNLTFYHKTNQKNNSQSFQFSQKFFCFSKPVLFELFEINLEYSDSFHSLLKSSKIPQINNTKRKIPNKFLLLQKTSIFRLYKKNYNYNKTNYN